MSVDPRVLDGPAYSIPQEIVPVRPEPQDPGFSGPQNPDGSNIGPLYLSPEAERWIDQNVIDQGYVIDWGTREIINPETGEVKGAIPPTIDRMT